MLKPTRFTTIILFLFATQSVYAHYYCPTAATINLGRIIDHLSTGGDVYAFSSITIPPDNTIPNTNVFFSDTSTSQTTLSYVTAENPNQADFSNQTVNLTFRAVEAFPGGGDTEERCEYLISGTTSYIDLLGHGPEQPDNAFITWGVTNNTPFTGDELCGGPSAGACPFDPINS